MSRYACLKEDNSFFLPERFRSYDAQPVDLPHKGIRWLPAPAAAVPTYNGDTQVLEGPTYTVGQTEVTESYSVRAKTAPELDADKEARLSIFDTLAFKVLFDQENRLRVLESKSQITAAQFRNALKAHL